MIHQYFPAPHPHNYRFELHKSFNISAAHLVPHPDAGKCQNLHGHTYTIDLTIAGDDLSDAGFLVDFRDLKRLIHDKYDHTLLNDHKEFKYTPPTSETFAEEVWETVVDFLAQKKEGAVCLQVIVRETPESYVAYRPKRPL